MLTGFNEICHRVKGFSSAETWRKRFPERDICSLQHPKSLTHSVLMHWSCATCVHQRRSRVDVHFWAKMQSYYVVSCSVQCVQSGEFWYWWSFRCILGCSQQQWWMKSLNPHHIRMSFNFVRVWYVADPPMYPVSQCCFESLVQGLYFLLRKMFADLPGPGDLRMSKGSHPSSKAGWNIAWSFENFDVGIQG